MFDAPVLMTSEEAFYVDIAFAFEGGRPLVDADRRYDPGEPAKDGSGEGSAKRAELVGSAIYVAPARRKR
jgi:hypothetical protein